MTKYKAPKGLFDILPYGCRDSWQQSHLWQYVETIVRSITHTYGFQEIRTPVFEQKEIFCVGIGSTSDIISKEMYDFQDKKGRFLALRPEGTSAILRAFFERSLLQDRKIHKLFYLGPMFRYEKPQAGRYRQHHQFGVEVLGSSSYEQDAEVIDLLLSFYQKLGIEGLSLEINSVGDATSREAYKKAFASYLSPKLSQLSKESQIRFSQNILRILDSKDLGDKEILKNAPSILEYLSKEAKEHFSGLESSLQSIGISYKINPQIVRGLDYYNQTVFEISANELGAQNAIGAGGRYDGFPKKFSGQNLAGIGFGTGIERILQTLIAQKIALPSAPSPFVFLAPMDLACKKTLFLLAKKLREKAIPTEIDLKNTKLQNLLKSADHLQATYTLILGEEEKEKGMVQCKHMSSRKTEMIPLDKVIENLEEKWRSAR